MEQDSHPQSANELDQQARGFVAEHVSLVDLRENAKNNLYNSTPEMRQDAGKIYGNVASLNRDHIAAAKSFADENLPELIEQATNEATAEGYTINPLEIEEDDEKNTEVNLLEYIYNVTGGDIAKLSEHSRLMVAAKYCRENDIDMEHLGTDDIFAIRALPEWQNVGE